MNISTTPYETALLDSAIRILKSDPRKDELVLNIRPRVLDSTKSPCSNQGSQVINPVILTIISKEKIMAKAPSKREPKAEKSAPVQKSESVSAASIAQEAKQAVTSETKAANELAAAQKMQEREAKKLARETAAAKKAAELQASGRKYVGPMLALADRVKEGVYVKSVTGQLRSNDELAQAFDGVDPINVVDTAMILLDLETNPYSALNVGQQSMNLRNRLRGAIRKGTVTLDAIRTHIAENNLDGTEFIEEKRMAKARAKTEREAQQTAKAKVKKEPATAVT